MITPKEMAEEMERLVLAPGRVTFIEVAESVIRLIQSRAAGVQGADELLRSENPDRKDFTVDEALRIADQNDAAYKHAPSVSRTLAAEVRRLATPQPPKDAGAVPLPKMVGMISDRPICFQDEVARYGNAREAAGRADAVLYEVANNLMLLVEGPGSLRWEDGEGFRLKDTSEWARFYVEVKNAKERTIPHHPPAEPAARAQVGALGFARPAELDDVRRNKDSHAAIAIFLQPEKSDAHSVPIYTHPSPAHAGAGAEAVSESAMMEYARGKGWPVTLHKYVPVGDGTWYHNFDITIPTHELAKFFPARRLAGGDHA